MEDNEKDIAIQVGIALDTYVNQALQLIIKLNPVEMMVPLTIVNKAGEVPILERSDPRFKGTIDNWLSMYDDTLKRGRSLPADLMGRAASIAADLNQKNGPKS